MTEQKVRPLYMQQFESLQFNRATTSVLGGHSRLATITTTPTSNAIDIDHNMVNDPTKRRASSAFARRTVSDGNVVSEMNTRSRGMSTNMVELAAEEEATAEAESIPSSLINNDTNAVAGFHLRGFMEFIRGEKAVTPLKISDERDLQIAVDRICSDLNKADDWNKRIHAMITLQSLAWGTLPDYHDSIGVLRKMQDQVRSHCYDAPIKCYLIQFR
jgi:hypothetical protein